MRPSCSKISWCSVNMLSILTMGEADYLKAFVWFFRSVNNKRNIYIIIQGATYCLQARLINACNVLTKINWGHIHICPSHTNKHINICTHKLQHTYTTVRPLWVRPIPIYILQAHIFAEAKTYTNIFVSTYQLMIPKPIFQFSHNFSQYVAVIW